MTEVGAVDDGGGESLAASGAGVPPPVHPASSRIKGTSPSGWHRVCSTMPSRYAGASWAESTGRRLSLCSGT